MAAREIFQQSIYIDAPVSLVEHVITDQVLMHRWLNPLLRCEPEGRWSTDLGSRSRFVIQVPGLRPSLASQVIERRPGLVVWSFEGFFTGRDRWECQAESRGTRLLNRFEFQINHPWVAFGFHTFAAEWTRRDMQSQLQRLKRVAEHLARTELIPAEKL